MSERSLPSRQLAERPRRRGALLLRQIGDDHAVYDPYCDRTTLLNATAAMILELADGTRTTDDISAQVAGPFSMPATDLRADVEEVLSEFAREGFLERTAP